jgi:hypothetical protein
MPAAVLFLFDECLFEICNALTVLQNKFRTECIRMASSYVVPKYLFTTLSASQTTQRRTVGRYIGRSGCGLIEVLASNVSLGAEKTTKYLIGMRTISAGIRNEHLPNTLRERYCNTKVSGVLLAMRFFNGTGC